jgi:hypothetical protein
MQAPQLMRIIGIGRKGLVGMRDGNAAGAVKIIAGSLGSACTFETLDVFDKRLVVLEYFVGFGEPGSGLGASPMLQLNDLVRMANWSSHQVIRLRNRLMSATASSWPIFWPTFLAMVWRTSPQLTAASLLLRLMRALLPVVALYIGKLIIDDVVLLVQAGGQRRGGILARPADSGRQRPRRPASPAAKPRNVKDYSDGARKPELRRTAWWWMQSSTTRLHSKFPASREFSREFLKKRPSKGNVRPLSVSIINGLL